MDHYVSYIFTCDEYVFVPELKMLVVKHIKAVRLVEFHCSDSVTRYKLPLSISLREWWQRTFASRSRRLLQHILFEFDCSEHLPQYRSLDPFPSNVLYHCERDRICYNPTYTAHTQLKLMMFYYSDTLVRDIGTMIVCTAYWMMCSESCYYDEAREPPTTQPLFIPSTRDRLLIGDHVTGGNAVTPTRRTHEHFDKKQPLRARLTRQYTRR